MISEINPVSIRSLNLFWFWSEIKNIMYPWWWFIYEMSIKTRIWKKEVHTCRTPSWCRLRCLSRCWISPIQFRWKNSLYNSPKHCWSEAERAGKKRKRKRREGTDHRLNGAVDRILLHLLRHVRVLYYGFSLCHRFGFLESYLIIIINNSYKILAVDFGCNWHCL